METKRMSVSAGSTGIGMFTALGVAIAVQVSWTFTHNVWWTMLHGWLSWIYIVYRAFFAGWPA